MDNLNLTKKDCEFLEMLLYMEYINILDNKTMLEWMRDLKLRELEDLCEKIKKAKEKEN